MGVRRGPQGRATGGNAVPLFELWASQTRMKDPTIFVFSALFGILFIDISLTLALQWILKEADHLEYSLRRGTYDLVWLASARLIMLPLSALAAYCAFWREARKNILKSQSLQRIDGVDGRYDLLEDQEADEFNASRHRRADVFREIALSIVFVEASFCQGYIGVKMCVFDFEPPKVALLASLMGLTTILVNLEAWLLSNVVRLNTRLLTKELLGIHRHPLARASPTNNWCDVCEKRITTNHMWRCAVCNFDVCLTCYARCRRDGEDSRSNSTASLVSENTDTEHAHHVPLPPSTHTRNEAEIGSWEIVSTLARIMRPDFVFMLVALVCVLASGGANLALPSFQGRIIDAVYSKQRSKFRNRLEMYLIFSLGAAATSALRALCFQVVGRKLACTLRNKLYAAIVSQDVAFFDATASGTLTSRLAQDINQLSMPMSTLLGTLLSSVIQLIGGVSMAFYTSWRLSMLAFTTVGPILQVTQAYASWSQEQNRKILAHLGEANGAATEALANIRTVKAMGCDAIEVDRYSRHTCNARDRGIVDAGLSSSTQLINNLLDYGAGWIILFYGGILAMRDDGALTAGKLVTYQLYFNKIQASYNSLIALLSSFTRASGAAQRVLALLTSLPNIDPDSGHKLTSPPKGELHFHDVCFAYEARPTRLVLKGLDLHVPAGSTLAIVGRSGSGKTSTLNLVLRFYDPQRGAITLDNIDLRQLNARSYRKYCALVAQETQLFDKTIYENITYGTDDIPSREAVLTASRDALADEFIMDFPHGYDTRIGERGVRISGGQKQRISIARAFLRKPSILLLDEATSALDAESEAKVQRSLDLLIARGGSTVLLVAHRLSTVRNADLIAVMQNGSIVELGSHDELVQKPDGTYATLVRRQLESAANAIDESSVGTADVDRLLGGDDGKDNTKNGGSTPKGPHGRKGRRSNRIDLV